MNLYSMTIILIPETCNEHYKYHIPSRTVSKPSFPVLNLQCMKSQIIL